MNKRNLYLDFDNCIVNTIKRVVDMYNNEFKNHKDYKHINWTDIQTFDFKELSCANKKYINTYFNSYEFFEGLEFMENAEEIILELSNRFNIVIVSFGDKKNIEYKKEWISRYMPYAQFVPCSFEHKDKSHIDMSDGIFIDDEYRNLNTSNSFLRICYGECYEWNKRWEGIRLTNWTEVRDFLKLFSV